MLIKSMYSSADVHLIIFYLLAFVMHSLRFKFWRIEDLLLRLWIKLFWNHEVSLYNAINLNTEAE